MAHSTKFIALLALTFSVCSANTLQAGQIVNFNWYSGVASFAATPVVPPVAPNNDNAVGLSPNEFFVTQKAYFANGPVDTTFCSELTSMMLEVWVFSRKTRKMTTVPATKTALAAATSAGGTADHPKR